MLKGPFRHLASLRLAVFIIVSLAVIAATGTIIEARYNDAEVAQALVYRSFYMYGVLGLLCVNLIAVMVDRWPWKQHHAGFVLAHIGILFLLFGAWLTQKYGIDGSVAFGVGEERKEVTLHDRSLTVYSSLDGNTVREIYEASGDFLQNPPSSGSPLIVSLGNDQLKFIDYEHFAFRHEEIAASPSMGDGPAVRFQLENPNVNVTEWLTRERKRPKAEVDLGPAVVSLGEKHSELAGRNQISLVPLDDKSVQFKIVGKDGVLKKEGLIKQSETVDTGWMGLKFRMLRYLPHAREKVSFEPAAKASKATTSALKFVFNGEEYWLGLNTVVRLYLTDRAYLVSYGQRQISIPFGLKLREFRMGKYQGTERASSYESAVDLSDRDSVVISMNEPLKHRGYTFYQSSFESDERGQPTASILSVNYDPGRWIKYVGSLFIVAGAIVLFYFKRIQWIKGKKA